MTTVTQAVKKLVDIHTGAVTAKETALAGYSTAQEQYAHSCAELSVSMGDKWAGVADALAQDDKTKSLASKTRLWGNEAVRGKVEDIFKQSRKINDGGSVYNAAYAIASKVKDGNTPAASGKLVKEAREKKASEAKTEKGAKDKAFAAVKRALHAYAKYTDDELAAIKTAIDTLAPHVEAEPAPAPEAPAVEDVSVTDALPTTPASGGVDEELGSLLAGLLNNGVSPERAAQTVSLLRK